MKIRHILFPVDFSVHSRQLTYQVEFLARRFAARVTLLHVFEVPATWYGGLDGVTVGLEPFAGVRGEAKEHLNSFPIALPLESVERVLSHGEAGSDIAAYANQHNVDLIVMGTHGCGRMRGLLLGSVAAKVMHDAACPVWTESFAEPHPQASKKSKYSISNIVCALELAPEGEDLLRFAANLGESLAVPVSVVHGIPTGHVWPARSMHHKMHEYLMDSARDEVSKLQRRAGTDFPVTFGERGIGRSVAESVTRNGSELILIGRGKAQEAFGRLRTHGYEIIREAPCPVLSYPLSKQVAVPVVESLDGVEEELPIFG